MYPTIHTLEQQGAVNPLHAGYPSISGSSSSNAGPTPPPRPPPRANGPPTASPTASFPTLQVAIDPRFQVAPPVRAPPQPPGEGGPAASVPGLFAPPPPPGHPAPGSREPLNLDLERKLMQELAESSNGSDSNGGSSTSGSGAAGTERQDPYEVLLGRYTGMGYSREQVAMALVVVGPADSDKSDKIVDACRKYKELSSLGFRPDRVVGALIVHSGDMEQAGGACADADG